MTSVTIPLSDDALRIARAQAVRAGFPAIEGYLQRLVEEQLQYEVDAGLGGPESLAASSVEQAVRLIREGLASPLKEMTAADFASLRDELSRGSQDKSR